MKIVIITAHNLHAHPWTTRVRRLATGLAAAGAEVTAFHYPAPMERIYDELPFPVHELPPGKRALPGNAWRLRGALTGARVLFIVKPLRRAALTGLWASLFHPVRIHVDYEDRESAILREMGRPAAECREAERFERALARVADTLSASSAALGDWLAEQGREAVYLPACIERVQPVPAAAAASGVVYFGQGSGVAAYERFIGVARTLAGLTGITFHLILAAVDARERERLTAQAGSLPNLNLRFDLPAVQLEALLGECQIAYLPFADSPAFRAKSPLKIVESMARGLVVVTDRLGETPRLLGEDGVYVDGVEPAAMVREVIEQYPRYRHRGERLAARASQFRADRLARNLLEAWNRDESPRR